MPANLVVHKQPGCGQHVPVVGLGQHPLNNVRIGIGDAQVIQGMFDGPAKSAVVVAAQQDQNLFGRDVIALDPTAGKAAIPCASVTSPGKASSATSPSGDPSAHANAGRSCGRSGSPAITYAAHSMISRPQRCVTDSG